MSEQLYSIKETTLTGIADSLRKWHGETYIAPMEDVVVSKTPNATGFNSYDGGYGDTTEFYDVVTIPGASSIKVKMAYQTESTQYDWIQIASGNLSAIPSNATKYGGTTLKTTELLFENTDTITFYFRSDSSGSNYLGYYAECTAEKEVLNTFKPEEMAAGIDAITYFSDEDLVFTGNCEYLFAYDKWKSVIERDAARLIIDPTSIRYVFQGCTYTDLSGVTIACTSTAEQVGSNIFADCNYLEKLPSVTGLVIDANQGSSVFSQCHNLWDENELIKFFSNNTYQCGWQQGNSYFNNCYSLRNINEALKVMGGHFLVKSTGTTDYDAYNYSSMFERCMCLDEIRNIPLSVNKGITVTSNKFDRIVYNCNRVKDVIFETNDGEPIVLTMKGQTISFTDNTGYASPYSWDPRPYGHKSGITEDKEVKDDATYQALKNDPDWWTGLEAYSRYNHDSAVNTINSLPDTSAYGTNTIKFKGAAGSATDGGAINTLTEEEIAVAAAKGWTVALS